MATMHSKDVYRTAKSASQQVFSRKRETFRNQPDAESQGLIDFIRRLIRKLRNKPAPPVPDAETCHVGSAALSA